jgi:hypothetical protein
VREDEREEGGQGNDVAARMRCQFSHSRLHRPTTRVIFGDLSCSQNLGPLNVD